MNSRALKIAALFLLALVALAPDAEAQRRRGGRGGGGRRATGARAVSRNRARPAPEPVVTLPPLPPSSQPKGGHLESAENQFRAMLARIDRALEDSERRRDEERNLGFAPGRETPRDIERGTLEWRALQRPVFITVDYDSNGWLAYSEMRASLGFDRAEFALYDRDRDARVTFREFVTRYDEIVAQTGAFRIPIPDPRTDWDKGLSPAVMRNEFDSDADGALDLAELEQLLLRWKRIDLSAEFLLERLDLDEDGRLSHGELTTLSHLSQSSFFVVSDGKGGSRRPASVLDLFGQATPREPSPSGGRLPPLIAGPLPHFARLDLDRDGYVTTTEFAALQEGSGIYTRSSAVLAALDLDGDGRLSEREFSAGLSAGSPGAPRSR